MIKTVLSWLHLRQDALTAAKTALNDARQVMAAQRATMEALRELNEHLIYLNNELIKVSDTGEAMADWNEFPICPHCKNPDQDWWDGLPQKNDGDTWNATCADCGKDYIVTMSVDASFLATLPPSLVSDSP